MRSMRAAVFTEPKHLEVRDIPVPEPGTDDVLIRVHACGICGSDVHTFRYGLYVHPGQILGHEFTGDVVSAGSAVEGISVGDRVTGFTMGFCGECFWCQRGEFNLCPEIFERGLGYGRPGALADYTVIERARLGTNIFKVPDSIDDITAATIEPVSVAVGAVSKAKVQSGDLVVVLGGGLIGIASLQVAKAKGAKKVVLVEVSRKRLSAAKDAGADAVFDARSGDPLEWVKQEIGVGRYPFHEGGMADVVIEAAGAPETVAQSFEMVRSGGTIAFVGLPEKPAPVDTTKIIHKSPTLVGCLGGDFKESIDLLREGSVRTSSLVTHKFDLSDVQAGFETQQDPDQAVKVVVTMQDR